MRHLFFICILTLLSLIPVAHAASSAAPQAGVTDYYVPLVGLPFVTSSQPDFQSLVNAFYKVAISVAAFLAVGKIVIAGVKYMMTDVVSAKGKARDDIRAAIVGLLIVIGAVLILNTINPQLTNLAVLKNAPIPNVAERGMTGPQVPTIQQTCPYVTSGGCGTWCTSKGLTYDVNTHNCVGTANNPLPAVSKTAPNLNKIIAPVSSPVVVTSFNPTATQPGGKTIQQVVNTIVSSGKTLVSHTTSNFNANISTQLQTEITRCKYASGGTTYQVFVQSNGYAVLYCFK